MASCPYCLEDIRTGARKCPHCQTSFEAVSEAGDSTVYVVDKGLIKFAKFIGGVLAVFVLIGVYLFGFDIKEASEHASEAKIEVQEALVDIERQKTSLDAKIAEIEERVHHIEALEHEIAKHRDDARSSVTHVKALILDIRRNQEEAGRIVLEFRTLGTREETVALAKREQRGIEADRGKLWDIGSTLKFHFLDGEEPQKIVVRAAVQQWSAHVNLTFDESTSPEAEIRISFEQPGSWSYIGTDALGIPPGEPTLNYGFLAQTQDEGAAMQMALHEFGHALGLVHEFQNPDAGEIFDRNAILAYYEAPPNNWTTEQVNFNVLGKSPAYPGSRSYDAASIMNYSFPLVVFLPGKETRPGNALSEGDKRYVASLYPQDSVNRSPD